MFESDSVRGDVAEICIKIDDAIVRTPAVVCAVEHVAFIMPLKATSADLYLWILAAAPTG